MDEWKAEEREEEGFGNNHHPLLSVPSSSGRTQDPVAAATAAARKVHKADREKLRRDRLNDHFLDLGNALDPDKPKNDKATILGDTIQILKDLTAHVNRLKAECATLSEESRELTQEKNELREEKASLKSDIDSLNVQYQQRLRVMFPWSAMDPAVMMGMPAYPFPMPVPTAPIPMHPSLQPFPFFHGQNPGAIPNPCSTFIPYSSPCNPQVEQPSIHYGYLQASSRSNTSSRQDSRSKSSDVHKGRISERNDDSNDVATDLELKTPGSAVDEELSSSSSGARKQKSSENKQGGNAADLSCSSRCSSQGLQDSSSSSVGGPKVGN